MSDVIEQRIGKAATLRDQEDIHFPYRFEATHTNQQFLESFDQLLQSQEGVTLSGRIMFRNKMGKVMFLRAFDSTGRLQWMVGKQQIGDEAFDRMKSALDIGDICGATGTAFRTKKGEPTLLVSRMVMLAKCARPLPEKYHSLKDKEARYRHRELDLIMNREVYEIFKIRSATISFMRDWLQRRGFVDVEIPTLQMIYGGAEAAPFKTHVRAISADAYLSISPELFLKRLVVGGFEKVFTISKNFRNEGIDATHYPEFTSLESYEAMVDYNDVREMTQDLLHDLCKHIHNTTEIEYQGAQISFARPYPVLKYFDVLQRKTGLGRGSSHEEIVEYVKTNLGDQRIDVSLDRARLLDKVFGATVEPDLVQPTFVVDYPRESSPLCRPKKDDPDLIERFELYVNGMEVANAYSELNDSVLQRQFLTEQTRLSSRNEEIPPEADEDFMQAIEYGLPPTGGLGIGLDRIVMFLANADSIREVILFPFMRQPTTSPPTDDAPRLASGASRGSANNDTTNASTAAR